MPIIEDTTKKPLFTKDEKRAMQLCGAIGSFLFPKDKFAGGLAGALVGFLGSSLFSQK